jgi:hypothetical protein
MSKRLIVAFCIFTQTIFLLIMPGCIEGLDKFRRRFCFPIWGSFKALTQPFKRQSGELFLVANDLEETCLHLSQRLKLRSACR